MPGRTKRTTNPLDTHLGYQLRRASNAMMGQLARRLAGLGLRPTEASILILVEANPAITQSVLGNILGVQRPNMAPLVGALLARGLIGREAINGKSHGFELTPEGRVLVARVNQEMLAHEDQFFGAMPELEKQLLLESLKKALQDQN